MKISRASGDKEPQFIKSGACFNPIVAPSRARCSDKFGGETDRVIVGTTRPASISRGKGRSSFSISLGSPRYAEV